MARTPAPQGLPKLDPAKSREIAGRLGFLLLALVIYRIGTFIPVPGINPQALADQFGRTRGTFLDMFNMFSGGALSRLSILALGVMPYISASIIVQLMGSVIPQWKELRKEGESGRRTLTKYTRWGTLGLALFQAIGTGVALQSGKVAYTPGFGFLFTTTVCLVTGTMFLMWLGEQITERGIGNGMSMIIFAGIVATLPRALINTFKLVSEGSLNGGIVLLVLLMSAVVTAFVVFVERAQRKIRIEYARHQQGRIVTGGGQVQYLPLKLNMSGVIPPIFASSLILFPASLVQFFGGDAAGGIFQDIANALSPGQPLHMVLYAGLIIFFCFFYTALAFDSKETAENLKRSQAIIPGVRPGSRTAEFIDAVLMRITVWGALYITVVCLLPEFFLAAAKLPFAFGGTSLLITVVVVMDFMAQLQAHMMSQQYEGLMRKANLKGTPARGTVAAATVARGTNPVPTPSLLKR